jgi:lysophospholipase L1-like esterase
MDRELFTGKYGSTLLFLRDDIRTIKKIDRDVVIRINENMNRLAERLEKIGIRLYFMPTVDKYDLYSDYIRDNNFPKNSFFDNLRPLEKNYVLIDTKKILSDALARGEKDIYLADDTHWSEKATRLIAEAVTFD